MNNKNFTLIELIVVIAILGILASLIVPNISSFKGDATVTAIASNVRNFQTAVDMYSLKNNGEYPTIIQPTEFIPQPIDFNKLDKKYLKTLPKTEGAKYWVDFQGRIWASTVDAPRGILNANGTITWEPVAGAMKYQVFEVEGYGGVIGALASNKTNLVLKGETVETRYVGEIGKYYVVNALDSYNFQSVPSGIGYEGYPVSNDNNDTTNNDTTPIDTTKVIFSGLPKEAFDKDSTTKIEIPNPVSISWTGNLENKVVHLTLSNSQSWDSNIYIKDIDGNNMKFIDMTGKDIISQPFQKGGTWSIVIPEGAKSIYISPYDNWNYVHDIYVDGDTTLPNSVTEVTAIPQTNKVTLNWIKPIDEDFSQVYIYREGVFIGSSTTTTFEDNVGLSPNTSYNYELRTRDIAGNISIKTTVTVKTLENIIKWIGASPYMFDKNPSTNIEIVSPATITWTGNLENRVVHLNLNNSRSWDSRIHIKDANGNNMSFIDKNGNKVTMVPFIKSGIWDVVIPEGAKSIYIWPYDSWNYINDIYEDTDGILPTTVSNLTVTPKQTSVVLNWTNPIDADYSKTFIYRNGVLIGSGVITTIEDKGLAANTTYNYEIRTRDVAGNVSVAKTITATTLYREIIWSGLDPKAFDRFPETSIYQQNSTITWTGNLTNRKVYFDVEGGGSWESHLYIKDANGNNLTFTDGNGLNPTTDKKYHRRVQFTIIVPANAKSFYITNNTASYYYDIYEQ